jgi:hypothetical protein
LDLKSTPDVLTDVGLDTGKSTTAESVEGETVEGETVEGETVEGETVWIGVTVCE